MSKALPTIAMELNQQMLTAAITEYVQNNLFGRPVEVVNIDFTAGRKANGHSATIEVTFANGEKLTTPVKLSGSSVGTSGTKKTRPTEPEPETETPFKEEPEQAQDSEESAEEEEEEQSAPAKKNLFKS